MRTVDHLWNPADDDVAIRYGAMADRSALARAAFTTYLARRYYGLSLWTRPRMSPFQIARAIIPYTNMTRSKIRAVHIGELRAARWEIADLDSRGHFNLRFTHEPDDGLWDRLEAIMSAAVLFDARLGD
jgi:hypothetical protein